MDKSELSVIAGGLGKRGEPELDPEVELRHLRNLTTSLLGNALGTWSEIYSEFEGAVNYGPLLRPEAKAGFVPRCGWPEFLEKMWLLQHYLNHARRLCEGRD
jgi:hypothetical protein